MTWEVPGFATYNLIIDESIDIGCPNFQVTAFEIARQAAIEDGVNSGHDAKTPPEYGVSMLALRSIVLSVMVPQRPVVMDIWRLILARYSTKATLPTPCQSASKVVMRGRKISQQLLETSRDQTMSDSHAARRVSLVV